MDQRHAYGREAESIAETHYRQKGFELIDRNYRVRGGEIDLVMWREGELLFVEVKGRRRDWESYLWSEAWGKKLRRLKRAIGYFLGQYPELPVAQMRLEAAIVTQGRVEEVFPLWGP